MQIRRQPKVTLSVATTLGFRRGQVLNVDGELLLLHRILGGTTLGVRPYRGWRRWRHRSAVWARARWSAAKGTVRALFERDEDEEWGT